MHWILLLEPSLTDSVALVSWCTPLLNAVNGRLSELIGDCAQWSAPWRTGCVQRTPPRSGTSSGGRLPQSTPSLFSFGIVFSALRLMAGALLDAIAHFLMWLLRSPWQNLSLHTRSLWASALFGFYAAKLMHRLNTQGQAMLTVEKNEKIWVRAG